MPAPVSALELVIAGADYSGGPQNNQLTKRPTVDLDASLHGEMSQCVGEVLELRSVAVPFGNCAEPVNVKAGGSACPIRFQCGGCGFYRPDPSFIPAIEEHSNSLRGDREWATALDVAAYVVDNLNPQISSFDEVLNLMQRRLEQLPDDERERIDASIVLRKTRASASLPLTHISRIRAPADD